MKVHVEQWQSGTRVIIEGLFGGELALSVAGAEVLSQQLESAVQQARAADSLSWDCQHCENRQIGIAFTECPNCGNARG